jgi:hypothetical protein
MRPESMSGLLDSRSSSASFCSITGTDMLALLRALAPEPPPAATSLPRAVLPPRTQPSVAGSEYKLWA